MKPALSKVFLSLNKFRINLILAYYRILNSKKKRILIYTDSRGHEITKLLNKHNPFSSYSKYFIRNYNVKCYTTPEYPTTLYDFFYFLAKNKIKYSHIICHVGVVDFAPRTLSQYRWIIRSRKDKIIYLFGKKAFKSLENFEGYDIMYSGQKTASLVPDFMIDKIASQFNSTPNLIWISCNPVLENWNGNYKERPKNSSMINAKSLQLLDLLTNDQNLDFTKWSEDEIRRYTCDNVHLTSEGMGFVEKELKNIIE